MRKKISPLGRVLRLQNDERGSQLVELAIALPVMIVLLGSVAEFGRFFYMYTTLTNAVRGGAPYPK